MSESTSGQSLLGSDTLVGGSHREGGITKVPPSANRRAKGRGSWRSRAEITLLSAPAVINFVAFVIAPVGMAAYYGLFSWKGYGSPLETGTFRGLGNYKIILTDPDFLNALFNNFKVVFFSLLFQGPISVLFALLLNKKMRGRSLIRVLIFVPYVVSEVIVGTGFSLMLQKHGAVNDLLNAIGIDIAPEWLANPKTAFWVLMFIISWKYIGFAVILFLAGMQGVPEELNEAAAIDGASYWKIQWHITLPLLGTTLRIWAFLSIIGSLQLFDLVYIIWGQYVASTAGTATMATYMALNGRLAGNYGYGNAVAVVIFVISLAVALVYQRFVLRHDTAGALTEGE